MKDSLDTRAAEIFPIPAQRGRPKTGKAKSRAEIQREYRQRKASVAADALPSVSRMLRDDLLAELDSLRAVLAESKQAELRAYRKIEALESEILELRSKNEGLSMAVIDLDTELKILKRKKRNVT